MATKKRALALIAPGTEEMELVITVDVLRRCEVDVTVALVQEGETGGDDLVARCSRAVNVKADTTLAAYVQQSGDLPDVVILPGGLEGARLMGRAAPVGELLRRQDQAGKLVAAICAAPTVLAAHGLLFAGRRLTSYPTFREQLTEAGYVWEDPAAGAPNGRVVRDGNLITSLGPATSFDFGLTIGAALVGQEVADKVAKGMLYNDNTAVRRQPSQSPMEMNNFRRNLSRFRLVTFDVTDTLLEYAVRPERHYAQVINSVLEPRLGLTLQERTIGAAFGRCFRTMRQQYPNFGCGHKPPQPGEEGWHWWWRTLVERVIVDAAAAGSNRPDLPGPLLSAIAEQLIADYTYDSRRVCWRQRPGVAAFLRQLRQPPTTVRTLGIVSNFDPRLEIILRNNGIAGGGAAVDFVLTSYEAGVEKPDAAIFAHALERANQLRTDGAPIEPHEALHVGNLCREDYEGARGAGWCALLVNAPQTEKNRAALATVPGEHVFVGLPELQRRLELDEPLNWKFSMRFYALSDLEIVQGRLVRRYCNNLTEALGLLKQQPEATMRTFSSIMEVLEYSFEYSFDDEEQYQEGRKKIHEYYVVYGVEISPDHLVKRVYDNLAKARDVLQQHSEGKIKIFADKQAAFDFYRKGSEVTF
uniref:DJ-1_PfpI domain-containing protein n=1 Tax=Anopheles dirus TaxID=7168 RepID=A0A182MZQ4_9DIPT